MYNSIQDGIHFSFFIPSENSSPDSDLDLDARRAVAGLGLRPQHPMPFVDSPLTRDAVRLTKVNYILSRHVDEHL